MMNEMVKAVGLMSGTSMDGVDAAWIETDGNRLARIGAGVARPYTPEERDMLRQALADARGLNSAADRLSRPGVLAEAEAMITDAHERAVRALLEQSAIPFEDIGVIGFHGHTVLHRPEIRLSVQLGDGQALADRLGIPVVYDLRAADIAAGGQGAPLAPVYHRALVEMAQLDLPTAVVNIGGVANLTWIGADGELIAFDTGPGNALLDDWVLIHTGEPLDRDGRMARAGEVAPRILTVLMDDPYFTAPVPKSLDRNAFSLRPLGGLSPEDGAATLAALTVETIALGLMYLPATPRNWVLSGGGVHNPAIRAALEYRLPGRVMTADSLGWQGDFIEAQAFAFLAVRALRGLPISFPGTTGVPKPLSGGRIAQPQSRSGAPAGSAGAIG